MRYVMEKVPGRDMWAVIDSVTHRPALVNDVPQIGLELDDADDLTDLLNRLDQQARSRGFRQRKALRLRINSNVRELLGRRCDPRRWPFRFTGPNL
jgi:hypothetical protein